MKQADLLGKKSDGESSRKMPSFSGVIFFVFSFIPLLFSPLNLSAVEPSSVQTETYDQLLKAIRQLHETTRERLEEAVEQARVVEAWETGKLIDEHVLLHKDRADYGTQTLKRLAVDLGMSHGELKYQLEFFRTYPIGVPGRQLSWSHYKALLSINDPVKRQEIEEEAVASHWSKNKLREELRNRQLGVSENQELEDVKPGQTDTYRIVKALEGPYAGELVIDLGFSNWYRPDSLPAWNDLISTLKEGDIVTWNDERRAFSVERVDSENKNATRRTLAAKLYTYRVYVKEILDGDTINAVIDLGFGFTTYQTLRLRGIDAPEIISAEGKEAKVFLEKLLRKVPSAESKAEKASTLSALPFAPCIIRTSKSDKYDRYLADIFVPVSSTSYEYVNQKLVKNGLATVVET